MEELFTDTVHFYKIRSRGKRKEGLFQVLFQMLFGILVNKHSMQEVSPNSHLYFSSSYEHVGHIN